MRSRTRVSSCSRSMARAACSRRSRLPKSADEASCTRVATGITTHALYVTAGCAYSTTDRPTEIFVFAIDAETGQLALQTERTYRSASLFTAFAPVASPDGRYVYGATPDGLVGMVIDPSSGSLTDIAGSPFPLTGAWL